mgnify:CR=1 FL=1
MRFVLQPHLRLIGQLLRGVIVARPNRFIMHVLLPDNRVEKWFVYRL